MRQRYELRLAGEGGQGLVLAGLILSEAAVLHDNHYAVQIQAYGPQVRGGISRSEVIIGNEPIDYPLILQADLLLALSQQACDCYSSELKPGGLLIVDADLVSRPPCERAIRIPITALAREATGRAITANVLSLGLIAGLTATEEGEVVSVGALELAVAARVPKATVETNLLALHAGLAQAELWKKRMDGAESLPEPRGP